MSLTQNLKQPCAKQQHKLIMFWLVFAAFTSIFYVMNAIIPFYGDDLGFYYSCKGLSFGEMLSKSAYSYLTFNGRFFCTFFMNIIVHTLGENVFNVVNTVIFAILVLTIYRLSNMQQKHSWGLLALCSTGLLMLSTGHESLYYWAAGAGSYLWPVTMLMLYLRLFFHVADRKHEISKMEIVGLGLLSIILGSGHEALTFPLTAGLFVHFVFFNRKKMNPAMWSMLIGLCIATMVVCLSPSSIRRFINQETNDAYSISRSAVVIAIFAELKVFYIFVLFVLALSVRHRNRVKSFLASNKLFLWILLFSFVLPILAGARGRASFMTEMISVLLLSRLISCSGKMLNKCTSAVMLVSIIYWCIVAYDSNIKWNIYRDVIDDYTASTNNVVLREHYNGFALARPYEADLDRLLNHFFTKAGMQKIKCEKLGLDDSCDIALPVAIPTNVIEKASSGELFKEENRVDGNGDFYTSDDITYFVTKWTKEKEELIHKDLLYREYRCPFLPFIKIFNNNFETHPNDIGGQILYFHNSNGDYILFEKKYHDIPFCNVVSMGFNKERPSKLIEIEHNN